MKSVRLGDDLERQVREVARLRGVSQSQVIREAVAAHCRQALGSTLDRRLADYVGALALGGGLSRATGRQLAVLLERRARAKARR